MAQFLGSKWASAHGHSVIWGFSWRSSSIFFIPRVTLDKRFPFHFPGGKGWEEHPTFYLLLLPLLRGGGIEYPCEAWKKSPWLPSWISPPRPTPPMSRALPVSSLCWTFQSRLCPGEGLPCGSPAEAGAGRPGIPHSLSCIAGPFGHTGKANVFEPSLLRREPMVLAPSHCFFCLSSQLSPLNFFSFKVGILTPISQGCSKS